MLAFCHLVFSGVNWSGYFCLEPASCAWIAAGLLGGLLTMVSSERQRHRLSAPVEGAGQKGGGVQAEGIGPKSTGLLRGPNC